NIGRSIARRVLAAGMKVIGYDPAVDRSSNADPITFRDWPDGIELADFLVLACALTATNVHMVDGRVLARAKRGLRVVNISRGRLIDEPALVQALESGRVHSVALDVFETEPLTASSRLRTFERCIFGSHNGSNTDEAVRRASELSVEILSGFLKI